jgi:hypothetical protein
MSGGRHRIHEDGPAAGGRIGVNTSRKQQPDDLRSPVCRRRPQWRRPLVAILRLGCRTRSKEHFNDFSGWPWVNSRRNWPSVVHA